jgi:hypothetical protein
LRGGRLDYSSFSAVSFFWTGGLARADFEIIASRYAHGYRAGK